MLVSKNPCVPKASLNQPNASHNQPNASHNASQWNIVRVGFHVGHVDFMLFGTFSTFWTTNMNAVSGGIWA